MSSTLPTSSEKQHIECSPDRCGGKPCIVGHRIRVQDIVLWTELGKTPDDIVVEYPQLSLADVHAALAFYFDHQREIDREIAEDTEFVEKMKATFGSGQLLYEVL
jgi:uncharacterized protein (DUF433 family)